MDIKTETFGTLKQATFDTACKYLKSIGKRVAIEFENAIIFGVAAVYKTGDATHINKVLPLLFLAKLEPMFYRAIVQHESVPFAYDRKKHQYVGKINVGRRAALEVLVDGIPQWETLVRAGLDGEQAEKSPAVFKLDVRLSGLIKKDRQQTDFHTDAEIRKMLTGLLKEFPAAPVAVDDSDFLSAEDQQRVEDNKTHLAGAVARKEAEAIAA